MKKIRDFLTATRQKTKNGIAQYLIDDWVNMENKPSEQLGEIKLSFQRALELAFNYENLVNLRNWISYIFADRISHICTDALWARTHRAHTDFIEEFNLKAAEHGIIITEKRKCVSITETVRDAGIIQVTNGEVSLTPKGLAIAEGFRKEIEDE